MNITVLYGGDSSERAVSLLSGERVCTALSARGHCVSLFDYKGSVLSPSELAEMQRVDALFLALHGGGGEGGALQAELEGGGIFHYTGSPAAPAALAMDKKRAKDAVAAAGIPVASGCVWQPASPPPQLSPPVVLKPLSGGSSVGLRTVWQEGELSDIFPTEPLLCEQYLPGREYTVGVLDGKPLPVVEIRPRRGSYDYETKYTPGAAEELCPAPIEKEKEAQLLSLARRAFEVLGLRDVARIDFKDDAAGNACFLEANTLPGLTKTSLLPLAARAAGYSFPVLCEHLARLACKRKR